MPRGLQDYLRAEATMNTCTVTQQTAARGSRSACFWGLIISTSVTTGCLPILERIYETPEIAGAVHRSGVPMPGLELVLADVQAGQSCVTSAARTRTDDIGQFRFSARTRWAPVLLLLPVHQMQHWQMCILAGDSLRELVDASSYQMGTGVRAVTLRCDLAKLSQDTTGLPGLARWNDPLRDSAPCSGVPPHE